MHQSYDVNASLITGCDDKIFLVFRSLFNRVIITTVMQEIYCRQRGLLYLDVNFWMFVTSKRP